MLLRNRSLILLFYLKVVIFSFIFFDDFPGVTVDLSEWLVSMHKISSFILPNAISFWEVALRRRSLKATLAFRYWLGKGRFFRFFTFDRHVRLDNLGILLNGSMIKIVLVSKYIRGCFRFSGEAVAF